MATIGDMFIRNDFSSMHETAYHIVYEVVAATPKTVTVKAFNSLTCKHSAPFKARTNEYGIKFQGISAKPIARIDAIKILHDELKEFTARAAA